MTVKFLNPQGRLNVADLNYQQIEKLRGLEGYIVLEPKVLTIHRRKEFVECEACSS